MDGNENNKHFIQLLDKINHITNPDDRLMELERQKQQIQGLMAHLPSPAASIVSGAKSMDSIRGASPARSHEIYQNLGPLMGSGLRNAPALPPKNASKFSTSSLLNSHQTFFLRKAFHSLIVLKCSLGAKCIDLKVCTLDFFYVLSIFTSNPWI